MYLFIEGQLSDIKSKQMGIDLILKLALSLGNGLVPMNIYQVQSRYFPSVIPKGLLLWQTLQRQQKGNKMNTVNFPITLNLITYT